MQTPTKGPFIAPSILSADFARLGEEIKDVEKAGADWIHVDVMDGHFVPSLTIGPLLVQAIRPITPLPLDCHLMVSEPEKWIQEFAQAGANHITIHAEATPHLHRAIHQIRDLGCRAGVSINPGSPLSCIEEVLDEINLVLVMSVNPGFAGQKFIQSTYEKVKKLVVLRKDRPFLIEIDGGIDTKNIGALYKAGVDAFVAGSAIFLSKNRADTIATMRKNCS